MFSAGEDFSIVTWYPPHDTGAVLSSPSQSPTSNLTTEGDSTESVAEGHLGDGTRASAVLPPAPLHAHHERPEGGNDPSGDVNDGRTGETAGSLNQRHDPGFVMHVAGVIGLSIIPGGIISADSGGRLLMRGPDKLIGKRADTRIFVHKRPAMNTIPA